ncbi:FtsK/SpoIIIE domain-containing protein [Nocardia sp. KC 131]|uniref:FtsK/SpoIIIE domain-containing protein n=1 Tax=Nocardia arseniciresistens TaxID=3392119 RepID=UPI00398E85D4
MSTTSLLVSCGSIAAAGVMAYWRQLGAPRLRPMTAEQFAAQAPPELRTAVFVIEDRAQTNLMFGALGLGANDDGFPRVDAYYYVDHGLSVDVQMLGGQSINDWTNEATLDAMSHYLGVEQVTARSPEPGFIRLEVRVFDTLAASAALPSSVPNDVDLRAVPVGITETGEIATIPILGTHGLCVGATGSGKGSVAYSILAALGPLIRDGLVDVYCIDPKGGIEFGPAKDLFVKFAYQTAEDILVVLKEAIAVMRQRQAKLLAAGLRKHTPTKDEPLILILLDEAAALASYADREVRTAFEELNGLLLTQARATAVSMFAFVQDPSKENMPQRQLYPVRIGLRLTEPTQVAMVFGAGARERGAHCDKISDTTPGVGYIEQDGSTALTRVRFYWVDDNDIAAMVRAYAPRHEIVIPADDFDDFDPSTFDPDDLGDEGPVAA